MKFGTSIAFVTAAMLGAVVYADLPGPIPQLPTAREAWDAKAKSKIINAISWCIKAAVDHEARLQELENASPQEHEPAPEINEKIRQLDAEIDSVAQEVEKISLGVHDLQQQLDRQRVLVEKLLAEVKPKTPMVSMAWTSQPALWDASGLTDTSRFDAEVLQHYSQHEGWVCIDVEMGWMYPDALIPLAPWDQLLAHTRQLIPRASDFGYYDLGTAACNESGDQVRELWRKVEPVFDQLDFVTIGCYVADFDDLNGEARYPCWSRQFEFVKELNPDITTVATIHHRRIQTNPALPNGNMLLTTDEMVEHVQRIIADRHVDAVTHWSADAYLFRAAFMPDLPPGHEDYPAQQVGRAVAALEIPPDIHWEKWVQMVDDWAKACILHALGQSPRPADLPVRIQPKRQAPVEQPIRIRPSWLDATANVKLQISPR